VPPHRRLPAVLAEAAAAPVLLRNRRIIAFGGKAIDESSEVAGREHRHGKSARPRGNHRINGMLFEE
jgi:hypothetical protein